MSYTKKTDIFIYETTDYDKFHLFEFNRAISKNAQLEQDIIDCNKLVFHPICVDQKYNILDGQHRFEIAKRLNLPLFYVIDYSSTYEEIKHVQSARTWNQKDYLAYYSKLGKSDYAFTQTVMNQFVITISNFISCFCLNTDLQRSRLFRSGKMKLKYSKELIFGVLKDYQDIRKSCFKYLKKNKLPANFEVSILEILIEINLSEDLKGSQLKEAIERSPDEFVTASEFHTKHRIKAKLVNDIFNKHKRIKKNMLTPIIVT